MGLYSTKSFRITFWSMMVAQALILFYSFGTSEALTTALQTTARLSGRLSLALFSWLVIVHLRDHQYKGLFLVFAVAHGIHLVELASYQYAIGNISRLLSPRVAGGMLAYAFIFAMPVLQSLAAKRNLGERMILRTEYFYLAFIWISFVMAYIPRVFNTGKVYGGSYFEFVLLFAWLIILFAWKLHQLFKSRNAADFRKANS